jgi:uncharacterized protein involved in exopolysaccharide biosynthesis
MGNSRVAGPMQGQSQPNPLTRAIGRHKLLVVACAVVLAVIGAAAGAAGKSTYTAAASLEVGKVNPNSPGFYGFVQSASDLAAAFSRSITAAPVLATVQRKLGLSPDAAVAEISAEPIPESPVFRVIASAPSAGAAVRLANVSSHALIHYEGAANTYSPESQRLLDDYRAASLQLARAETRVARATRDYAADPDTTRRLGLESAQASKATASLQAQALSSAYQLSAESTDTTELVSLLSGAVTAESNHKSKIELLGFIGLLAGLVVGCALAVLREQRGGYRLPAFES